MEIDFEQSELRTILESATGLRIDSVHSTTASAGAGGYTAGEKQLLTLAYTAGAHSGEQSFFVKQCAWKHRPESIHYWYLAAHGVPTPRLYGSVRRPGEDEIIFLEPLTRTGIRSESLDEWRAMFSLLARLNACPITDDYAVHLHRYELIGQVAPGLWLSGMPATLPDEEVRALLQICLVPESETPRYLAAVRMLDAKVAAQPQGLLHQDFLGDNVGWCGEEMVVFDLHKNARGPRFADAAPYLARPGQPGGDLFWSADEGPGTAVEETRLESLTGHYLEEYDRFGGPAVSVKTFLEEVSALVWAHRVACLDWFAEHSRVKAIEETLRYLESLAA